MSTDEPKSAEVSLNEPSKLQNVAGLHAWFGGAVLFWALYVTYWEYDPYKAFSFAISPTSQFVATSAGFDKREQLKITRLSDNAVVYRHNGTAFDATFSSDEHFLAFTVLENYQFDRVKVVDLKTLSVHDGPRCDRFALSRDGRFIATLGDGELKPIEANVLEIWDRRTNQVVQSFKPWFHSRDYNFNHNGVAISPDGQTVVAGGSTLRFHTLSAWDVETGKKVFVAGGIGMLGGLAFSPDGKTLAFSGDREVRFVDATTGEQVAKMGPSRSFIRELTFSPDGKRLVLILMHSVEIWNARNHTRLVPLKTAPDQTVHAARFTDDGQEVMTVDEVGRVQLWSSITGELVRTAIKPPDSFDPRWYLIGTAGGLYLLGWVPLGVWARRVETNYPVKGELDSRRVGLR